MFTTTGGAGSGTGSGVGDGGMADNLAIGADTLGGPVAKKAPRYQRGAFVSQLCIGGARKATRPSVTTDFAVR